VLGRAFKDFGLLDVIHSIFGGFGGIDLRREECLSGIISCC